MCCIVSFASWQKNKQQAKNYLLSFSLVKAKWTKTLFEEGQLSHQCLSESGPYTSVKLIDISVKRIYTLRSS